MNFFDFADNLKDYNASKFLNDLEESLSADESVVELQKEQWKRGEDFEGNILGVYSRETELISNGRKKAGEPFNLFDTGDFYRNTKLFDERSDSNLILSFDSPEGINTPKLLQRIGPRMFGLQKEQVIKLTHIAQNSAFTLLNTNLKIK